MTTILSRLILTSVVLFACAACGSDDGASVRTLGSEDGSGSASASGSGSGTAVADAACNPVNPALQTEAGEQVAIAAVDYAYQPAAVEVASGVTTFEVVNQGGEVHELAFLPGGGQVPFIADGEPDEAALEAAGAFELEGFGPGQTCNATYDLEPGEYTLFCIIQTEEGATHYEQGMRAQLTVT